jgi:hypothetical protein
MTETPTSRCNGSYDHDEGQIVHEGYCPMHGCPHTGLCGCPTKIGPAHERPDHAMGHAIADAEDRRSRREAQEQGWPVVERDVNDGVTPSRPRPERNVSVRVGGDPRPCTCLPGGMTWEPDCPRHAELVADLSDTATIRPPVADGSVPLDQVGRELIAALGKLGDEYGPTGVAQAARALVEYPREFWDQATPVTAAEVLAAQAPLIDAMLDEAGIPKTASILMTAADLVNGERHDTYGDAMDDFTRTGKMWAAVLGLDEVTAEQVAVCMTLVKIGRLCESPAHRDSWIDATGYMSLGGGIARRREAMDTPSSPETP